MSIATNYGHVENAIRLSTRGNLYFELAKSTAWTTETSPDSEIITTTDLDTSIAFKKVASATLVYPTTDTTLTNTITYGSQLYATSTTDDAYTNNAQYVLLKAQLGVAELSPFTFRQIGVRADTVYASSVTGDSTLAANVTDKGILLFYDNRMAQSYTDETTMTINYLIQC